MVKMAQKICLIYDTNGVRKSGLNHGMALLQKFNMKLNKKCLLEFNLKSKLLFFLFFCGFTIITLAAYFQLLQFQTC